MIIRNVRLSYVFICFAFLVILLSVFVDGEAKREAMVEWPPHRLDMTQCVKSLRDLLGKNSVNGDINELWNQMEICKFQLETQGRLDDFQIIRSKFYIQNYDDTVVLWMVVFITISGIILAGLQLLISYRLAVAAGTDLGDMGGEISLEKGKVSLKSSLSGIFILAISFAFFWLFVIEVYKMEVFDPDRKISSSTAPESSSNDGKNKSDKEIKNNSAKQSNFGIETNETIQIKSTKK
ncbi:hypothetical protein QLH52_24095 [Methylomonas sp. OY6]|uniref:MotA/TolQ/ExbB proton channel family protein n=1 Tax=Methylomonas defluvii TaxID=3045149 RepID=A0ABU4UNV7_9GAMM|nr:hypothetical protein [Methylomonas sp. OY6]MDX8130394.1 hypothetical protein [Methylomonas sp. OY6]